MNKIEKNLWNVLKFISDPTSCQFWIILYGSLGTVEGNVLVRSRPYPHQNYLSSRFSANWFVGAFRLSLSSILISDRYLYQNCIEPIRGEFALCNKELAFCAVIVQTLKVVSDIEPMAKWSSTFVKDIINLFCMSPVRRHRNSRNSLTSNSNAALCLSLHVHITTRCM